MSDARELFDMRLAHVGINAENPEEAADIAAAFQAMLGLEPIETPVSVFSDTFVETMKQNGRGEKGHIGFWVNDVDAAEAWFADRGYKMIEESRAKFPDGRTKLIYFEQPIGGFAIHLVTD
jgi:catechol 2,3-dioxygenase-like lactoylglutathione lyase family enzyme